LHRRARERGGSGVYLGGELRMRREKPPRVARAGYFINWIQGLRLK